MLKDIVATNVNGAAVRFDELLRIVNGLDLSGLTAEVNRSTGRQAGSIPQNTRLQDRSFALEIQMRKAGYTEIQMDDKRGEFYRVFDPNANPIRIDFKNSVGKAFYLTAYLEGTPLMSPDKNSNNAARQNALLQFLAPDPYVYASDATMVEIATWVPAFSFPLSIPSGGIRMGYRSQSLIKNVPNSGGTVGMVIVFEANASLSNPSLININTYETLKLNINMLAGDVIIINTITNQKAVTLTRGNVTTNIMNAVDIESKFLQLRTGDNLFRYDATSGIDNLKVRMEFRNRYVGV